MPNLPIIPRAESLSTMPWVSVVLFVVVMVLVFVVSQNRQPYASELRNLFNSRSRFMVYDAENTSTIANILLWVVVVFSYALLAFTFISQASQHMLSTLHFIIITLAVGALLGLKWLIMNGVSKVFEIQKQAKSFIGSYYITAALLGGVSLVIAAATIYTVGVSYKIFLIIYVILSIFTLTFVLFKAIQIFYHGIGSLFYIFLYLCTLEIMPALMIIKVASMV